MVVEKKGNSAAKGGGTDWAVSKRERETHAWWAMVGKSQWPYGEGNSERIKR